MWLKETMNFPKLTFIFCSRFSDSEDYKCGKFKKDVVYYPAKKTKSPIFSL